MTEKLYAGDVPFSIRGDDYIASLDIAALEAIQTKYGKDPFDHIAEIVDGRDYPKVRELMVDICLSNGIKKVDLPNFGRCSFQGLMSLAAALTVATVDMKEAVGDAEKKPPKKPAKTAAQKG